MIENFYYSLKIDVENVGALTGYPLSLTVDGEDGVDFIYLTAGGDSYMVRVPFNPKNIIAPLDLYPETQYTKKVSFSWKL
jgi:hypothetical protein